MTNTEIKIRLEKILVRNEQRTANKLIPADIKDIKDIIKQLSIYNVSVRKIVRCEDPMVCLRGCSVHEQTCKHPIYER